MDCYTLALAMAPELNSAIPSWFIVRRKSGVVSSGSIPQETTVRTDNTGFRRAILLRRARIKTQYARSSLTDSGIRIGLHGRKRGRCSHQILVIIILKRFTWFYPGMITGGLYGREL